MPAGKPIECKAAIAWEAKKPLEVRTVTVAPPGPGEVRVQIKVRMNTVGSATEQACACMGHGRTAHSRPDAAGCLGFAGG